MLATDSQVLLRADFDVVDMVSNGHLLAEAAFELRPDVIVTDISMPIMGGIEAVRKIRGSLPGIRFIFLTMHGANGGIGEKRSASARRDMFSSPQPVRN